MVKVGESVVVMKEQLRTQLRQLRNDLNASQRHQDSIAIAENFLRHIHVLPGQTVALYASITSEVETQYLFERLCTLGVFCAFPRINAVSRLLDFARVQAWQDLQPGTHGILEPLDPALALSALSTVVVPGLGFDAQGHRLGYGGGFYDRTLANFTGQRVALCYTCQIIQDVPVAAHDCQMTHLVTSTHTMDIARLAKDA